MDSSLRSSLPHLTRWFTTVLGQNEVKEVLAGLNLKESVPKGAVAAAVAPKTNSSSGKGLSVYPLEGNWHQNSQTSFVCFLPFDAFPQPSSWHRNSHICFVCLDLSFVTCNHQPLLAFTVPLSKSLPCFGLDSLCTSLPFTSSCALLVCDFHHLLQFQRQALLLVQKPWKRLLQKVWLLFRYSKKF